MSRVRLRDPWHGAVTTLLFAALLGPAGQSSAERAAPPASASPTETANRSSSPAPDDGAASGPVNMAGSRYAADKARSEDAPAEAPADAESVGSAEHPADAEDSGDVSAGPSEGIAPEATEAASSEDEASETDEPTETPITTPPGSSASRQGSPPVVSPPRTESTGPPRKPSAARPSIHGTEGLRLRLAGLRRTVTRHRAALREAQREMGKLQARRRHEPQAVASGRLATREVDRAIVELNDAADQWSNDLVELDALAARLQSEQRALLREAESGGGHARIAEQCAEQSRVLLNLLRVRSEALSANIELAGALSSELSEALDKLAESGLLKVSDSRLTAATIREAGAECAAFGSSWRRGVGQWWRRHLQLHLLFLVGALLLGITTTVGSARGALFLLARWSARREAEPAGRGRDLAQGAIRPVAVGLGLLLALNLLLLPGAVHSLVALTAACLLAAVLVRVALQHWASTLVTTDSEGDSAGLSQTHARAVTRRTMGVVWVNAVFLPLLAVSRTCEDGSGPMGLLLQLAYGTAFVVALLVAAYGSKGWLALPTEEGTTGRRLRLAARLGLPVLVVGLTAVIGLRALGYYNLSVYLGRNLPVSALVLVALGWLWRALVPLSVRLVDIAVRGEGLAPDLTAALQRLMRTATVATLLLVAAALLLESWGRLALTDRLAAAAWLSASGVAGGGLLAAVVLPWVLRPLRLLAGHWESALIRALSAPLFFACALTVVRRGAALCLAGGGQEILRRGYRGAAAALAVFALLRLVSALSTHYLELAAQQERGEAVPGVLLGRKVANMLLLALGATFVLWQAGFEVRPLLATLGIGSLAVAMALQDTLKNLFAGFYVMMDRSLKPGDFVSLDSGEQGFIEDIGWRNTKIRPYANNLIVIPNSKISEAVVTNENLPREELSVYVACGVSYDSDLDEVERIAVEVGRQTSATVEGAATDWEPRVRFKEFGDSNINFVVVLRVVNREAQYLLTHEFIKALHRRFNEEGIVINYPVRDVLLRSPAETGSSVPS